MTHQNSLVNLCFSEPTGFFCGEKHFHCDFLTPPFAHPHFAIPPFSNLPHHLNLFSNSALNLGKKEKIIKNEGKVEEENRQLNKVPGQAASHAWTPLNYDPTVKSVLYYLPVFPFQTQNN